MTGSTPAAEGPLTTESTAQRVFSIPTDNEGTLSAEPTTAGTITETGRENTTAPADLVRGEEKSAETSPTSPAKHAEPVASRIAPSITSGPTPVTTKESAGTTTVVSAGTAKPSAKDTKSEGKVSSWLKNKLKRSSKTTKSAESSKASPSEAAPQEKGFVGGATLAAKSNSSVNRTGTTGTEDSEREVAMAGKPLTSATVTSPEPDVPAVDLYHASPAAVAQQRRSISSSSISSLSSSGDEARGRTRLPREPKPMTHNLRQSLRGEHPVGPIAAGGAEVVDPVPAASGTGRGLDKDSSDEEVGEEFEEAKDTFDSEALRPPRTVGTEAAGRASDSPVRDSKFSEDL